MTLGRILSAELLYEPSIESRRWPDKRPTPMPTFSSNDRSRWCTVRALVDKGTYVIGHRYPDKADPTKTGKKKYGDDGIVFDDGWETVDKVMKPGTGDFYSSKPPLLSTLLAGEYWLLKHGLDWSITERPWSVIRVIVLTVNGLPWIVYLVLLARLIELFGVTEWGQLYVLAAACFATLMTPFLISINNHTVAACSATVALYLGVRIALSERPRWWSFVLAGFFASFAACIEMPAAAFAAGLGVLLLWRYPRPTLLGFAPAAVIPVAAFFLTNYLAIGELLPVQTKGVRSEWYQYPGSHWAKTPDPNKPGIDFARTRENWPTYAFHLLLGHHGLFSLTPIYLLALVGMVWGVRRLASRGRQPPDEAPTGCLRDPARVWGWLAASTLLLTVVVVGFYLIKTNNYGGWTNGPRWLMWLTPFWLLSLLPVADRLSQSKAGRGLAYVLLALSVLSASYFLWNPWRHPWIYNFMDSHGWIPY
jgi:hypothetical protein